MTPPVLILQHLHTDGPAYLAHWLQARGLAADVRNTQAGQAFPDDLEGYAALAILGGEMSANDPLPSLRQAEALILQALSRGLPLLGHCLGGQLMARALGARVRAAPDPEVGWHPIERLPGQASQHWLGEAPTAMVFQWHNETFELPPGATPLACSQPGTTPMQQAFALGPHQLAMQFHVEVDAAKLALWIGQVQDCAAHARLQATHGSVHGPARMQVDTQALLAGQQALADRIYARWWAGVQA